MIWISFHGRPVHDAYGNPQGLNEIFRETTFSASDRNEALGICDAIAQELLVEYGPPILAVLDTEENWKNG